MPESKNKRLGDILNFKRGYDLPAHSREVGEHPVISSSGISGYHSEYKVDGEGVITGRYGTLGEMYYINGKYWPHNTALYVTDFKGNVPKYVYYLLTCLGKMKTSDKSAVPGVNRNELHEVFVPYLDPDKQSGVADVLSVLDAKIDLNNRINAELEAMARTLYEYWFVQFDFPNENGKPYKSSGGKMDYDPTLKRSIPEGWEVKDLSKIALIKKGVLITESTAVTNGHIKVISAGIDYSYHHNESNYPTNTITISASGANAGFINFWREPIFASDCTVVRGKTDQETLIILHFLKMRQEYIYKQARGSAQPHVYPKDIEALKIEAPPIALLNLFGESVLKGNEKISQNIKENIQLTQLRDWLLPMLMNGQVKVTGSQQNQKIPLSA